MPDWELTGRECQPDFPAPDGMRVAFAIAAFFSWTWVCYQLGTSSRSLPLRYLARRFHVQ